ncbi:hypothetical protein ACHAXA_006979 [Cyclostephanos tholiformis]|uniref:Uncharacterized protein n=1 Tax=Cyclostephanos tholiformis TaxID=382380 RepID=A0ABD3RXH1_9STRA
MIPSSSFLGNAGCDYDRRVEASFVAVGALLPRGRRTTIFRKEEEGGGGGGDEAGRGGSFDLMGGEGGNVEMEPLNRIFQRAVVLQRMGDRGGCLAEYERFLNVAETYDVDPSLYAEVRSNMGAVYAMESGDLANDERKRGESRRMAKHSFGEAVKYRPGLGSAWVNLALLILSEGKEIDGYDHDGRMGVTNALVEARQCCVRAMGMDNDDERSRSLANKLIGDIDTMLRQQSRE